MPRRRDPAPVPEPPVREAGRPLRRLLDSLILRAHRLADRFEALPPDYGAEAPIDENDPRAVMSEWLRCLRLWAAYSPEQVFALKVGATLLLAALIALWLMVGMIR